MSINAILVSAAFLLCAGATAPVLAVGTPGNLIDKASGSAAIQSLYARNGADDGAAHNANDQHKGGGGAGHARNGADDGANHDRNDDRGRGRG